jgi:hypothetical protein
VEVFGHSDAFYNVKAANATRRINRERSKEAEKKKRERRRERKKAKESREKEKRAREKIANIIWKSFTLTGAFRTRSLVLNVLCHLGFEYHPTRNSRTNFVFTGEGHLGNPDMRTYLNNKVGPGQIKVDMTQGVDGLERVA